MKLLVLLIGIAIGAAAVWYYRSNPQNPRVRETGQEIEQTARAAGDEIQEKLKSLNLRGDDVRDELARTGRVIRENTAEAGDALSDATAEARTTAAIKAKFLRDPELSALDISVDTTQGVVTLSGAVANPDLIGRAMLLAMETEGVKQVISTLQLKAAGETP